MRLVPEYFPEENVKYIVKFVEMCKKSGVDHFLIVDCEGYSAGAVKSHYKLLDTLDALDDIVTVYCRDADEETIGTFWFNMGEEGMEIFHDYTDNELCNKIYNQVEEALCQKQ